MTLNHRSADEGETYVELYVRSLSPRGAKERQTTVIDQLEELFQSGTISEYDVHVCGERLPATPAETRTEFGTYLLNRIAVFEQWAWHNDLSLDATFQRRHVQSSVTGEDHSEIVVPALALAEYEDNGLRFVAPARTADGATIAVEDRLTKLAERDREQSGTETLANAYTEPPENQPRKLRR